MKTQKELELTDARFRNGTWWRGDNCNMYPHYKRDRLSGLSTLEYLDQYIVQGWTPLKPFITKNHVVTVFGSCFAQHLINYLRQLGFAQPETHPHAQILRHGSGMVTTHTIRQQFEWAYENRTFVEDIWFANPDLPEAPTLKSKQDTIELMNKTDVFIITLGLSEVWCNKITGDVFWKAIPKHKFDPDIHEFRVTTCEENKQNLHKVLDIIKKNNPNCTVIFTLSPVTLVATFRPVSCISADSVSKAILRTAVDEVIRERPNDAYYWPSFEIIKDLYPESYAQDKRHVTLQTVEKVMSLFSKYYLVDGPEPKLKLKSAPKPAPRPIKAPNLTDSQIKKDLQNEIYGLKKEIQEVGREVEEIKKGTKKEVEKQLKGMKDIIKYEIENPQDKRKLKKLLQKNLKIRSLKVQKELDEWFEKQWDNI